MRIAPVALLIATLPASAQAPIPVPPPPKSLLEIDQQERAHLQKEQKQRWEQLCESTKAWESLYFRFANWPNKAYSSANRETQGLAVYISGCNSRVKGKPLAAVDQILQYQMHQLAWRVAVAAPSQTTGFWSAESTGKPEPLQGLGNSPKDFLSESWATFVILDALEAQLGAWEAKRQRFEGALAGRKVDTCLAAWNDLNVEKTHLTDQVKRSLEKLGKTSPFPFNGTPTRFAETLVMPRLWQFFKTRNELKDEAWQTPIAQIRSSQQDLDFVRANAGDELSVQLKRLNLFDAIQKDPQRLAWSSIPIATEMPIILARIRDRLNSVSLSTWTIPPPIKAPVLDTAASCDLFYDFLTKQKQAANKYLDEGITLAGVDSEQLALAERLGALMPTQRQFLESTLQNLGKARASLEEVEQALTKLSRSRLDIELARHQALADAPRLNMIAKLKSGTFGRGKNRVTLRNGYFERPRSQKFGESNGFIELIEDSVVLATSPTNGGPEAALVLINNHGGAVSSAELHLVRVKNGKVEDLGSIQLGNAAVKSLIIDGPRVRAEMLYVGDNDTMSSPSQKVSRSYLVENGELRAEAEPAEQHQLFNDLVGCLNTRASFEIILATDPMAMYQVKQLTDGIRRERERKSQILKQLKQFGLLRDSAFRTRIQTLINSHHELQDNAGGSRGFQRMNPGKQRAYLVLGQVANELNQILKR